MSESFSPSMPREPAEPLEYKDRRAGLIVFGIFTILIGCLAGLVVPLMFVGAAFSKGTPNQMPLAYSVFAAAIYGFLAVALIWLGIGSIKGRRWARALLLIFSWVWLVMGVIMIPIMAFTLPKSMANVPVPPGQPPIPVGPIVVVMLMIFSVIFVVLPGVWVFFYQSRHVKATCERIDPVQRWTDACPLPVLGVSLWLATSALMFLLMPVSGFGFFPFFGSFLAGVPGGLVCVAVGIIWAYAAWSVFRLEARGWWILFISMLLFGISAVVTYARHDVYELYQMMNFPAAQIEQMQKAGAMTRGTMVGMTALFMVLILGYLLFIKRFMRAKP